jgi:hypothetical protein
MKIHFCKQRSKEWEQVRLGKITASQAHCLMGNGWAGRTNILMRVAFERLTKRPQQVKIWSKDIARGINDEHLAREWFERKFKVLATEIGFFEIDEWAGASTDGFIAQHSAIVEIKCPNESNF